VIKLKKLLIILAIIITAGIGGLYLLGSVDLGEDGSFVGSLQDALSRGVALRCTFESESSTETIWLQGEERVYGEIVSADETGYIIFADNCMYAWGGSEPEGIKTCWTPQQAEAAVKFSEVSGEADVDLEEGDQYNCSPTTITSERFTPPANVEFLDFSNFEF